MKQAIDLTSKQREILRGILSRFADRIDRVAVYGSRVQGRARPGSDIDLVVHGMLSATDVQGILLDLEESDISVFVDMVSYDSIANDVLRKEIDRWATTLFDREDLLAARTEVPRAA